MLIDHEFIRTILERPVIFARAIGYTLIGETPNSIRLHDAWLRMFLYAGRRTLQAHRGSYKTSCLAVAITMLLIFRPQERILMVRKTDSAVRDVSRAVARNIEHPICRAIIHYIYGVYPKFDSRSNGEISLNIGRIQGSKEPQFMGISLKSSTLTGKHATVIFTDDIVTLADRISRAEREATKMYYDELRNISMEGTRWIDTGTPWHKNDCFTLMTEPEKFDVYEAGILTEEQIDAKRKEFSKSPELFACNYELRHIPSSKALFRYPENWGDFESRGEAIAHIDCAYGGEDWTALTILEGDHVIGKCWHEHWELHKDEIVELCNRYRAGEILLENNADKGYSKRELLKVFPYVTDYHEAMNKYIKITTYLSNGVYERLIFDKKTDKDYITMITDYNKHAEHDDAPDSLSSAVRRRYRGTIGGGTI